MESKTNAIEEAFKSLKNSHTLLILSSLLVGILFLSASRSVSTELILNEVIFLKDLESFGNLKIVDEVVAKHTANGLDTYINKNYNSLFIKLEDTLGIRNIDFKIKVSIKGYIPFSDKSLLRDQLIFWQYYGESDLNLKVEENIKVFGHIKKRDIKEGPLISEFKEALKKNEKKVLLGGDFRDCRTSGYKHYGERTIVNTCFDFNFEDLLNSPYSAVSDTTISVGDKTWDFNEIFIIDQTSYIERGKNIIEDFNLAEEVGKKSGILNPSDEIISRFVGLWHFVENSPKGKSATYSDATEEISKRRALIYEEKIKFPFGISLSTSLSSLLFPVLFFSLVLYSSIHVKLLQEIIPYIEHQIDTKYPIISTSGGSLVFFTVSFFLVSLPFVPLLAIYINEELHDIKESLKPFNYFIYSIPFITSTIYCRLLYNLRTALRVRYIELKEEKLK